MVLAVVGLLRKEFVQHVDVGDADRGILDE